MSSRDYPRMLFHRTKEPVTVQSREEEDALGREWSRTIWPVSAITAAPEPAPPAPKPVPPSAGYAEAEPDNPELDPPTEPEPEDDYAPAKPLRRLARNLTKPHARSKKKG